MASATRTVTTVGQALFSFVPTRPGTVTFFCNDLNIDWRVLAFPTDSGGLILTIHAGPILVTTSFLVGAGARVDVIPLSIGSGFPPPPLSLLEVQTDTVLQVPTLEEPDTRPSEVTEADPWEQS